MMFSRTEALTAISDTLALIKSSCELRGLLKLFDNHTVAQYFFCRLLNVIHGLELVELDVLRPNHPAIDLGDKKHRIAYQVTTEKRGAKIQDTLDTFVRHGLQNEFDTLKILIIGDRKASYKSVQVPLSLKFDPDEDIVDIKSLLDDIELSDTPKLERIVNVIKQETKFKSLVALSTSAIPLANLTIDIGVVRDPPAAVDPEELFTDDRIVRYACTKEWVEGEARLVVSPTMDYLSRLQDGRPIDALPFFHTPFKCHYPDLDITFVNNTGQTLAVTEAVFEVVESVPDTTPVIVFQDGNSRMSLRMQNEGWGWVRNPIIRCNIVPTGAPEVCPDPPIDHIPVAEPFAHEFRLADFETHTALELQDTFAALGVDVPTIAAADNLSQIMYREEAWERGENPDLWQHYGRFPDLESCEAWSPFPDGYAVAAGVLQYDDESGKSYSLPFRVRVFLFQYRLTLPMPPSYQYQIMLQPEGKKYEVFCPVSHSLKEGEADRIRIRVGCVRSASHTFRVNWRLSGGRAVINGPISLRHFIPRTWAGRRQTRQEVGQEDATLLAPPNPFQHMNCIDAAGLGLLNMQRAAVQQRNQAPPPPDQR